MTSTTTTTLVGTGRNAGLLMTTETLNKERKKSLNLGQASLSPSLPRSVSRIRMATDEVNGQYQGSENYRSRPASSTSGNRHIRHGTRLMANDTLNLDDTLSVFSEPDIFHSGRISAWNSESRLNKIKPTLPNTSNATRTQNHISYQQLYELRPITPMVLINHDGNHQTPEVKAVDPELKDAQKSGNQYHISMSLNAALGQSMSNQPNNHSDVVDVSNYSSVCESHHDNTLYNQTPLNNGNLLHIIPNEIKVDKNILMIDDGMSIKSVQSMPSRSVTPIMVMEKKTEDKVVFDIELQSLPETVFVHHSYNNGRVTKVDNSILPSVPHLVMRVNETMMMDYQPTTALNETKRHYKLSEKLKTHQILKKDKMSRSQKDNQTDEQLKRRSKNHKPRSSSGDDDPLDEQKNKRGNNKTPRLPSTKADHPSEGATKQGNTHAPRDNYPEKVRLPSNKVGQPPEETVKRDNNQTPKLSSYEDPSDESRKKQNNNQAKKLSQVKPQQNTPSKMAKIPNEKEIDLPQKFTQNKNKHEENCNKPSNYWKKTPEDYPQKLNDRNKFSDLENTERPVNVLQQQTASRVPNETQNSNKINLKDGFPNEITKNSPSKSGTLKDIPIPKEKISYQTPVLLNTQRNFPDHMELPNNGVTGSIRIQNQRDKNDKKVSDLFPVHEHEPSSWRSNSRLTNYDQKKTNLKEREYNWLDDDFTTDVQITRENSKSFRQEKDEVDSGYIFGTGINTSDRVSHLLHNAPHGSVRTTVNIQRQEEEIVCPTENSDNSHTQTEGMVNVDTISEKVDMHIADGLAQVLIKICCERMIPIRGSPDLFKKSSVIVSRIIDVDLTVTEERRQLYQRTMEARQQSGRLNNRDTFELYKTFMALAEATNGSDGEGLWQQQIQIDRRVDEERITGLTNEDILNDDFDKV